MLDKLSSLEVSGFIQENYRKIVIFKDGIHFCKELCIELANQLAKLLGLEAIDEKQERQILAECCAEDTNMLPIYPAVIKALDMDEKYNEIKYKFIHPSNEAEEVDFVTYVGRYIDYVQYVNDMWTKCGTRII